MSSSAAPTEAEVEAAPASVEEAVSAADDVIDETINISNSNRSPKLNHKNFINLFSYIANIVLVYGVGNAGWIGTPTNGELSDKYQTLVTPNSSAFTIWAVIFLAQGIYAILQLLPRLRAHPMVQQGVGYWYMMVAAMQIGWTFTFAYEKIIVSLVFMLALWVVLICLLYSQYYTESDGKLLEFWVLRFPFSVHAGWITAALAVNVNVLVVDLEASAAIQLAVAIVSLAVLHAVSVWVLFNIPRPNWTMACVLSWAFGWIYVELNEPLEKITTTFDQDIIGAVKYAAIAVSFIIVAQIVIRLLLLISKSCNPYRAKVNVAVEENVVVDEQYEKRNVPGSIVEESSKV
jgi:translocator protein